MLGGAIQEESSNGVGSKISDMAFVSGKSGSRQRTVPVRRQEGGGCVEGRKKRKKKMQQKGAHRKESDANGG